MRLAKAFFRLPLRFDVERLQAEIAAFPEQAWAEHPNAIAGNSALRLISVNGGENDEVDGVMTPTDHLRRSPYLRQVLSSFGVVWSRSRLLRLAPGAEVPEHADINYHWFNRVRLHIPIVTQPQVKFHCGDETVHMAAGEAWIFDNWRLHRVENGSAQSRVHLVADTSGTSSFWQLVAQSDAPASPVREVPFDAAREAMPLTERTRLAPVMSPAEVDYLVLDLRAELVPASDSAEGTSHLTRYQALLEAFCRDWRQLYALHGERLEGWPEYARLRDSLRNASRSLSDGLVMRTNRVGAHMVLEGRVLRALLPAAGSPIGPAAREADGARGQSVGAARKAGTDQSARSATATPSISLSYRHSTPLGARAATPQLDRPIFIVAAPRSGSTLLFETLAVSPALHTVGGEAHWLVEGLPELRPGAPGVESNRLTGEHATETVAQRILAGIQQRVVDWQGRRVTDVSSVRFLEKTPKNALRIPFFARIFPDAQFVFLWRDPRENLSSIMEAWKAGRWRTYPQLEGFEGPWSLLLPPEWKNLNRRPLEEIAAWQWNSANQIALDDLQSLGEKRWTSLSYAELLAEPSASVSRLCEFLHIDFDAALKQRVSRPLPRSRYTLTAPQPDKWRANEAAVLRVLPSVEETWARLRALAQHRAPHGLHAAHEPAELR